MKYALFLLMCSSCFLLAHASGDGAGAASESVAEPSRNSMDMPILIESPGSGRYASSRPNHHIPFGVYWAEAKPADFIWLFPSMVGGTAFIAVGNVIGWPCKATWNAFHGEFEGEAMAPPLDWSAKYFGIPGAYIVGGPFWVLKKSFIDFPVWLFGGGGGDASEEDDYDY